MWCLPNGTHSIVCLRLFSYHMISPLTFAPTHLVRVHFELKIWIPLKWIEFIFTELCILYASQLIRTRIPRSRSPSLFEVFEMWTNYIAFKIFSSPRGYWILQQLLVERVCFRFYIVLMIKELWFSCSNSCTVHRSFTVWKFCIGFPQLQKPFFAHGAREKSLGNLISIS